MIQPDLRRGRFAAWLRAAAWTSAFTAWPMLAAWVGPPEPAPPPEVAHEVRDITWEEPPAEPEAEVGVDPPATAPAVVGAPPPPAPPGVRGSTGPGPSTEGAAEEGSVWGAVEATPGDGQTGSEGVADGGASKVRPPVPPKPSRCLPADPRIRAGAAAGSWWVDRSLIDEHTRSIEAVNQLGYVKRHELEDGTVDGMILRGVKCGSPLHAAGFRSGDVVHAVNGKDVRSLAQGLLLYAKMRHKDRFEVEITRKGQRMTLTYDVR